jgi:hypothetical protein
MDIVNHNIPGVCHGILLRDELSKCLPNEYKFYIS